MKNRIMVLGAVIALSAVTALSSPAGAEPAGKPTRSGDTVIVKFARGSSSAARAQAAEQAQATEKVADIRGTGAVTMRVKDPEVAVERFNRSKAVEYAELNTVLTTQATPNDPRFGELWGLNNTGQTGGRADADIDAPEGWDAAGMAGFPPTGGAKVGIVDTGIDRGHPEFAGGRIVDCGGVRNFGTQLVLFILGADPTIVDDPAKCNDDNGHGTHVAGTVGANANNGQGVAGVAFNAELSICKALNAQGAGTLDMIANCIGWLAAKDVDVISMSLGGSSGSATLQTAVRNATNQGSLLVAASGNGGNSAPNYPAAYAEVVSVAATDDNDARASFSTFNADVEVAAPGVDVVSTWPGGSYRSASGTSMATPHAAAVAGVIAALNPGGGPSAWRAKLTGSTDDLGAAGRDPNFGFGRVNLAKAAQ